MADVHMVGNLKQVLENKYTKENSIFLGWNTRADGNGDWYSATSPVENIANDGDEITLYAQWLGIGQSIAGHTGSSIIISCKAGQTIEFPDLPSGTQYEIEEINNPKWWSIGSYDGVTGSVSPEAPSDAYIKNIYKAEGTATISAHKLFKDADLASGAFAFELFEKVDDEEKIISTAKNGPVDTFEGSHENDGSFTKNPWYGTAPIIFGQLTFTSEGEYIYYIREVCPDEEEADKSTIAYDRSVIKAVVTVEDKEGKGILTTSIDYFNEDGKKIDPLFENSMKTGDLKVSKTVENASGNAVEQRFTFNVILKDSAGNLLNGDYKYEITGPGSTSGNGSGSVSGDESVKQTIKIENGEGTFTLRDGETIIIHDLPHGASYEVSEDTETNFTLKSASHEMGTIIYDKPDESHAQFINYYSSKQLLLSAKKVFLGGEITEGMFEFELLQKYKPADDSDGDEGSGEDGNVDETESADETEDVDEIGSTDEFTLIDEGGNSDEVTEESVDEDENIIEINGEKYERLQTASNNIDGMVLFTPIDFYDTDFSEGEKEIVYYIREVIPQENPHEGTWYDSHIETVVVRVGLDPITGEMNITMDRDESLIEFTNYALFDLDVSKTVNDVGNDDEFKFTLTLGNIINGFHGMNYTIYSEDTDRVDSGDLTLDQGKYEFTLKADEKITFSNLPYGATYKIEETPNNEFKPQITVKGDEDAEIKDETISGRIAEAVSVEYQKDKASFYRRYRSATVHCLRCINSGFHI